MVSFLNLTGFTAYSFALRFYFGLQLTHLGLKLPYSYFETGDITALWVIAEIFEPDGLRKGGDGLRVALILPKTHILFTHYLNIINSMQI